MSTVPRWTLLAQSRGLAIVRAGRARIAIGRGQISPCCNGRVHTLRPTAVGAGHDVPHAEGALPDFNREDDDEPGRGLYSYWADVVAILACLGAALMAYLSR